MADIKSYMKEKEKRERRQTGYKEKIIRHKLANIYRILLLLAGAAALIALIVVQYKRHVYTDYDIIFSVPRESVSSSVDIRLGNAILSLAPNVWLKNADFSLSGIMYMRGFIVEHTVCTCK